MDKLRITQLKSLFDEIGHFINNDDNSEQVEIWFARELQEILGYTRWENFIVAIQRAVDSCKTQNINNDDHFSEVTKMIELGSREKHEIIKLKVVIVQVCSVS
jgi:DNA-damage-inducible protein D